MARSAVDLTMASGALTLNEGERLDDLQVGGYRLIQRRDAFRFGTDSVLLADFAAPRRRDIALDLGCGTGAIATLMLAHCPGLTVDGVELQAEIAELARRSAKLNDLEARFHIHTLDARDAYKTLGAERYTLIVCNPPYRRSGSGAENANAAQQIARGEDSLSPDQMALSAFQLLRTGGRLCAVFPAARAYALMRALDAHRLTPKRIRTVHARFNRPPKLILLEAVKYGGEGLKWLEPLNLYGEDGQPTEEYRRIYRIT